MVKTHIQKVLAGDADAFRFIVKEYKDDAYTLAFSVVKNEDLAMEVVQVAFIKAYKGLDAFRGESKFSTWFYRIVINEAFNQQIKEKKKPDPIDMLLTSELTEEINTVFLSIEKENQRYYINETLMKLPAKYSLVLRLFYLNEFNLKEISKITGWTNSNTRVLLHRARQEMKKMLTDLFKLKKEDLY